MKPVIGTILSALGACLIFFAPVSAQRGPQSETVRQAQQLARQGKFEEALALYRQELKNMPDSVAANSGAGVTLDLMGKGAEARKYFQKAIDAAPTPQAKAGAERAMAMSYAFEGDCKNAAKYEQMVFDASQGDFFQQGEIANETARVCIDSGDLDAASKWYKLGHDTGLKEPGIQPGRKDLWEFRWEHAQARLAARRGNKAEAQKHVAAAKAALDAMQKDDPGQASQQAQFLPYLTGYVAFYGGDYKIALEDLQKANQDPFIETLIGETYAKLGDKEKAAEYFKKGASAAGHNPPAAYAHRHSR